MGPAFLSFAGGVQAHDGEVDALECGGLGGEMTAGVDRPPDPSINRLNRVGGANDRADLGIELEKRHELRPRVRPQPDDRGILALPFLTELSEGIQRSSFRRRSVDWLEIFRDRRPVLLRGILERIAQ